MGARIQRLARSIYTAPYLQGVRVQFPAIEGTWRSRVLDSALGTKGLSERNALVFGLNRTKWDRLQAIEFGFDIDCGGLRDTLFHGYPKGPHRDPGFTLNRSKSELGYSQIKSELAFITKESAENDLKLRDYDFYALGHDPSSGEFPVTRESIINRNYSSISELFNPLSKLFERFRGW